MRDLYARIGESAEWSSYLDDLRDRYRTLRALKDEMKTAGL
jgi:hypothetical protein